MLNEDYIKKWSSQNGNGTHQLKQIVLDDMTREGKKHGLMSYEQVKIIEFINEPFSIENGLLTPTFKSRRSVVEKKYKNLFETIYKHAKE